MKSRLFLGMVLFCCVGLVQAQSDLPLVHVSLVMPDKPLKGAYKFGLSRTLNHKVVYIASHGLTESESYTTEIKEPGVYMVTLSTIEPNGTSKGRAVAVWRRKLLVDRAGRFDISISIYDEKMNEDLGLLEPVYDARIEDDINSVFLALLDAIPEFRQLPRNELPEAQRISLMTQTDKHLAVETEPLKRAAYMLYAIRASRFVSRGNAFYVDGQIFNRYVPILIKEIAPYDLLWDYDEAALSTIFYHGCKFDNEALKQELEVYFGQIITLHPIRSVALESISLAKGLSGCYSEALRTLAISVLEERYSNSFEYREYKREQAAAEARKK